MTATSDFDTLVAAASIKVSLTLGESVKPEDVEQVTDAYLLLRKQMSTLYVRKGCGGESWTVPGCRCYDREEHVAWKVIRSLLKEL